MAVSHIAPTIRNQRDNADFLQTPNHGIVAPTFRMVLPVLANLNKKILYENAQRLFSSSILDPVKLTVLKTSQY